MAEIICADVLEWCKTYDGPKFHALLCDPPYELGFMGKDWDKTGIVFNPDTWAVLAEHLHPGAFGMAFASSRGWHRLAVAIEDSGLRIHPAIFGWNFSTGFPKATRVTYNDKALDKTISLVYNELWKNMCSENANNVEESFLKSLIDAGHHMQKSDFVVNGVVVSTKEYDLISYVNIAEKFSGAEDISESTFIVAENATSSQEQEQQPVRVVEYHFQEGLQQQKKALRILFVPVNVRMNSCESISLKIKGGEALKIELGANPFLSATDTNAKCVEILNDFRPIILNQLKNTQSQDMSWITGKLYATNVIITKSITEHLITSMADTAKRVWESHRYGLQAMKPALEPIIVFQVPYEGKPVECIVETGAGALNIDGSRIGLADGEQPYSYPNGSGGSHGPVPIRINYTNPVEGSSAGRWPANFYLGDEEAARRLGEQSGAERATKPSATGAMFRASGSFPIESDPIKHNDTGTASRFFFNVNRALDESDPVLYCAKASRKERDAGLSPSQYKKGGSYEFRQDGSLDGGIPWARNNHPTVKPIDLTRWLATLLLPPTECAPRRILVPFSGSGSEMIGAHLAGWEEIIGIEMEEEYIEIAKARLEHWTKKPEQLGLL